MQSSKRPRALIFDWDNTLVETWGVIHAALNETLGAMGHPLWTLEETRSRVRASAREAFPAMFGERATEAMDIFYQAYEAGHLKALNPCPGADELLRDLAGTDSYYMAVLSNKKGALLREEAVHLGWNELFHKLIGANDAALDKPAKEAVTLVLEGSGLAPAEDIWLVGDTDIDMLCARRNGLHPVLLRPRAPEPGEFADAPPAMYFQDCRSLHARLSAA
jgi:phosphoglycolate phosphatase